MLTLVSHLVKLRTQFMQVIESMEVCCSQHDLEDAYLATEEIQALLISNYRRYLKPLQSKLFLTKFVYIEGMSCVWAEKYVQFV